MLHNRTYIFSSILLLSLAAPTTAQDTQSSDNLLGQSRIGFSAGTLTPQRSHTQRLSNNQNFEVRFADVTLLGLNFEAPIGYRNLALRASVDYGADQIVSGDGGPCGDEEFCGTWRRSGDLWLAHVDAIYRLRPERRLQPHLSIGVGTQHFTGDSFMCMPGGSSSTICSALGSYARKDWRASGRVGAGLEMRLGNLVLASEMGSHLSRIEPEEWAQETLGPESVVQYDIYWTAGLRLITH